jgi:hypothetical protein
MRCSVPDMFGMPNILTRTGCLGTDQECSVWRYNLMFAPKA